jgi:ABC-type glycerol-3-phosphate transport system substrate-binding protein
MEGFRMRRIMAIWVLFSLCFVAPVSQANTTIQYMFGGPTKEAEIQAEMARAFELANPEIKVELLHTAGDYVVKFQTMVAGGTPPDVLNVNSPSLNEFIASGVAQDITAYVRRDPSVNVTDFFPSTMKAVQHKEHYYALPLFTSPVAIFLNDDHLDASGVVYHPNLSFADFATLAQKLTRDLSGDNEVDRWGLERITYWGRALKWAWSHGGDFWGIDDNFNVVPTFDHPGNIAALEFWQDLAYHRPVMGGNWWSGTATMLDAPWSGSLWGMLRAAEESSGLRWSVAHQPTGPAGKASTFVFQLMMIPASSSKHEAAYSFASWMASRAGQRLMQVDLRYGGVPTRRSVLTDPGYLAIDPRIKAFVEVASYMRPLIYPLQSSAVSSAVSARVEPLLRGELSPKVMAIQVQEILQAIAKAARESRK